MMRMDYKETRKIVESMMSANYKNFIKSLISIEKDIKNEDLLDKLYSAYMENDEMCLLADDFDCLINQILGDN